MSNNDHTDLDFNDDTANVNDSVDSLLADSTNNTDTIPNTDKFTIDDTWEIYSQSSCDNYMSDEFSSSLNDTNKAHEANISTNNNNAITTSPNEASRSANDIISSPDGNSYSEEVAQENLNNLPKDEIVDQSKLNNPSPEASNKTEEILDLSDDVIAGLLPQNSQSNTSSTNPTTNPTTNPSNLAPVVIKENSKEHENEENNNDNNESVEVDIDSILSKTNPDSNVSDNEKDKQEIEEDEVVENVLPLSQAQSPMQRVMGQVNPDGTTNKRVIAVALFLVVGLLAYWGSSDQPNKPSNNNPQILKTTAVEKSELKNTFNTPDVGQCSTPVAEQSSPAVSTIPAAVQTPPPVIIPVPPAAPPEIGGGASVATPAQPAPVQRQYAFQLRAGGQIMKNYQEQEAITANQLKAQQQAQSQADDKNKLIARGTPIPMMMLEPFRNDLPRPIKCQVMADIKNAKGIIVIPAGSIANVPFSPFRNDKRVFNRIDAPTTVSVNDGKEIQIFGSILDRKGFIGLEGKVRRTGDASFVKRMGRTMGRVLTFGAASTVGGAGGYAIAEAGNSSIDSSYAYTTPTGSYVELPLGTTFIFNVNAN